MLQKWNYGCIPFKKLNIYECHAGKWELCNHFVMLLKWNYGCIPYKNAMQKRRGWKVHECFDTESDILHPPLTMKDLKQGTWSAKRTETLRIYPNWRNLQTTWDKWSILRTRMTMKMALNLNLSLNWNKSLNRSPRQIKHQDEVHWFIGIVYHCCNQ